MKSTNHRLAAETSKENEELAFTGQSTISIYKRLDDLDEKIRSLECELGLLIVHKNEIEILKKRLANHFNDITTAHKL